LCSQFNLRNTTLPIWRSTTILVIVCFGDGFLSRSITIDNIIIGSIIFIISIYYFPVGCVLEITRRVVFVDPLLIDLDDEDVVVAATLYMNIDDDDDVSPKNSISSDSRGMDILESSTAAEVASGKRYELQTRTVPCGLMVYRPQLFDVQWCLFSVELSVSEVSNRVPTLLLMDRLLELLRFLRSPLGPHVDVVLPKTIVDDKTTLSYAYFGVVRPPSTHAITMLGDRQLDQHPTDPY
jgi:hypothetical protein